MLRNVLLSVYGIVVIIGVVAFLATPMPTPATEPFPGISSEEVAPDTRVNWAEAWRGGQVRASGWDHFRSHHPLYLIDGESHPTTTEKWATRAEDPFPWAEVVFPTTRNIDEIVLRLAGWRESPDFTNDRFIIRCLRGDELVNEIGVLDNTEPIARYTLSCPDTDRVWVWFDCTGPVDVGRLYEIEAWGTP